MTKVSRTPRSAGVRNFAAIAATVLALPILGAYTDPPPVEIGFRVVRTPAPPTADFDADGNVDLRDFAPLSACPTGPGGAASALCTGFDFDHDTDVDLRDLSSFMNLFMTSSP